MPAKKKADKNEVKPVKKKVRKTTTKQKAASPKKKTAIPIKDTFKKTLSSRLAVTDTTPDVASIPVTRTKLQYISFRTIGGSVDFHRAVTQTARFAGLFFVVAGAILTLINIQGLNNIYASLEGGQLAAVLSEDVCLNVEDHFGVTDFDCEPYRYGTGLGQVQTGASTESCKYWQMEWDGQGEWDGYTCIAYYANTVLSAPDSQLGFVEQVTGGRDTIGGEINVKIFIEHAQKVDIYLKDTNNHVTQIGVATKIGTAEWIYRWNTINLANGSYQLYTKIRNDNSQYALEYDDGNKQIKIQNTAPSSSTGEGTQDPAAITGSFDSPDTYVDILFNEPEPLSGDTYVKVHVNDPLGTDYVEKITIFVDGQFVGQTTKKSDSEWEYRLQTGTYADGLHTLYAKGYEQSGATHVTDAINFEIQNTSYNSGSSEPNTTNGTTLNTSTNSETDSITNTSETDANTITEAVPLDDSTEVETILKPEVKLDVRASSPLSGFVELRVDTIGAQFVEIYAVPRYALAERFLGLAARVEAGRWLLRWNTTNTPNGEYNVFARVKNSYGVYDGSRQLVSVYNQLLSAKTATNDAQTTSVQELQTQVNPIVNETLKIDGSESNTHVATELTEAKVQNLEREYNSLLATFKEEINEEMQRFRSALRSGDAEAIEQARKRIDALQNKMLAVSFDDILEEELIFELHRRVTDVLARFEQNTEQSESLVTERVGEAVTKDSDQDGISDYDEVNIYDTDPFVADTDGDGFNDGAEILNGYNPNDNTPETLVSFESPKESGVIREDYLVVESIASDSGEDGVTAAVIRGRALPNSFVTLYVFSTPVVVTVKTEDDGSWSYRFDKELEDGTHEVYVGITDNAGKIIAKSNPFSFIKTAEAFTPVDASASSGTIAPTNKSNDSLLADNVILIILSIAVVAIGLVLMLLGLHLQSRKPELQQQLSPI